MPLTNGQKTALYLLLTSRSELRLMLEGKFIMVNGVPIAAEHAAPQAAGDPGTLVGRFTALLAARFGGAVSSQINPAPLTGLFAAGSTDPNGAVTNLNSHPRAIRAALEMDGPYPPDDPCPNTGDMVAIFGAVAAAVK